MIALVSPLCVIRYGSRFSVGFCSIAEALALRWLKGLILVERMIHSFKLSRTEYSLLLDDPNTFVQNKLSYCLANVASQCLISVWVACPADPENLPFNA